MRIKNEAAQREQTQFDQQQNAYTGLAKNLGTIYGFQNQTATATHGPIGDQVSSQVIPSDADYAQGMAGVIRAGGGDASSLAKMLGDLQAQHFLAQSARESDPMQAARLASLGIGEQLKGHYSVNSQGLRVNELTGATNVAAPELYGSLVAERYANANQTNARTPLEIALLESQAANQDASASAQINSMGQDNLREEKLQLEIDNIVKKQEEVERADEVKKKTLIRDAESVIDEIRKAREEVSDWATGLSGAIFSSVPGTEAFELRERIKTIEANIGFDQATVTSLDPNLGKKRLLEALDKIELHYRNWIATLQGINPDEQGGEDLSIGQQDTATNHETGEVISPDQLLEEARQAIAKGADPQAVVELLQSLGGDPTRL